MAGIGIGSVGSYNSVYYPLNASKPANQMASGKKINSAADDAAGLAIAKKLESQAAGSAKGADNARDMRNAMNVADGGMSQISSGLERIRELSVQSKNSIYGAEEKAIFQEEIKGILGNIDNAAKNTNYNGKNVLDGSFTAQSAIVGANGQAANVSVDGLVTDSLGLSGYDVSSGNYSIDSVDKALDTVLTQQATVGAYSNRLEHSERAAENAYVNTEASRSRIEDADIAEASRENNRQNITQQVGMEMQKLKMQGMGNFLQMIG